MSSPCIYKFNRKRAEILYDIYYLRCKEIYICDQNKPKECNITLDGCEPFKDINDGPISEEYWLRCVLDNDEEYWFDVTINIKEFA